MTTINTRAQTFAADLTIIRQGKLFYTKGHVKPHAFMASLSRANRISLGVPVHAHAVQQGPYIMTVPKGRPGSFPVTIANHERRADKLYTQIYPICSRCQRHDGPSYCSVCGGTRG